jgi:hypothetical protein
MIKLTKENIEKLKTELLKLKLKEVISAEDKLRIQYIQQFLDRE